ncbi:MAG: hypothetical protein CSA64_01735 [Arachnia propionica]|nr:MAG: hypothetical protein CSA64_01735 [Arachnia propionica]
MSAPGLVLAAVDVPVENGSALTNISQQLCLQRPDLVIATARFGNGIDSLQIAVDKVTKAGRRELVVVPLDLAAAAETPEPLAQACDEIRRIESDLAVCVARPIGPAVEMLMVLDQLVRAELNRIQALEVDALILASPAGGDARGTSLLARRARQWSAHHRLPTQTAVMTGDGNGVALATKSLRNAGRRHIAVGTLAIEANELYRINKQSALNAGAMCVTGPIPAKAFIELILARYAYAAMSLLRFDDEVTPSE